MLSFGAFPKFLKTFLILGQASFYFDFVPFLSRLKDIYSTKVCLFVPFVTPNIFSKSPFSLEMACCQVFHCYQKVSSFQLCLDNFLWWNYNRHYLIRFSILGQGFCGKIYIRFISSFPSIKTGSLFSKFSVFRVNRFCS